MTFRELIIVAWRHKIEYVCQMPLILTLMLHVSDSAIGTMKTYIVLV